MIRVVTAVATLGALAGAGAAAPQGGKVVRVERRTERVGTPRHCTFAPGEVSHAQCLGPKVEVGETIMIVSTQGVVAKLAITSVTRDVSCSATSATWDVEGDLEKPAALNLRNLAVEGVIDGALDSRRARTMLLDHTASARTTDTSVVGFDTDGDGFADLQFEEFACDAQGVASQAANGQCYETWSTHGRARELERMRIDIVPPC